MILAAALLIAVTLAAIAVLWHRSLDLLIRRQARRQVVVELRDGATFRGLLVSADSRTLQLRDVESLVAAQSNPVPVDGELLIPRADVKYLQRP